MGRAQFYVSAGLLAASMRDVIDFPWPKGMIILEEDETEWQSRRCLRVIVQHPDIPESDLEPLWCVPSFFKNGAAEPEFDAWNFREDWE